MSEHRAVRREPQGRRTELVDAARQLLSEQPFEEIGMANVATAGDVSRPSVYRYFPGGRSEVFIAVAESGCALSNLELVLAGAVDGESALRATCALATSGLR